jgi:hypothetical protein
MMLLEVDPNLVRPGWTPLVVILLLGVVLFFLGRSMIKQFGRIDVPSAAEVAANDVEANTATEAEATPTDGQAPRIPDLRARTPDGGRAAPPDQR